jgi:hypothetical protein
MHIEAASAKIVADLDISRGRSTCVGTCIVVVFFLCTQSSDSATQQRHALTRTISVSRRPLVLTATVLIPTDILTCIKGRVHSRLYIED